MDYTIHGYISELPPKEERQKRLEAQAQMGGEMHGEARRKNVIGATTAQRLTASK